MLVLLLAVIGAVGGMAVLLFCAGVAVAVIW